MTYPYVWFKAVGFVQVSDSRGDGGIFPQVFHFGDNILVILSSLPRSVFHILPLGESKWIWCALFESYLLRSPLIIQFLFF